MYRFTLSAFADEIDPSLQKQIEVLKRNDVSYIELRSIDGKNVSDFSNDYAQEVKKTMDGGGIAVSAIGSPIGKIHFGDDFNAHFDKFKHVAELAELFGTKYIRLFSFYPAAGKDIVSYREEVISNLQKMVDYVKNSDLVLLHENEKDIYGDVASRCLDVLSAVNSPKLRATFDPANFVQCGQKVFPEAYDLLKPYIEYVHIKDAMSDSGKVVPAGHGDGNVKKLLDALKKDNFNGFLSLEPHLGDFKGFADLEEDSANKFEEKSDEHKFELALSSLRALL